LKPSHRARLANGFAGSDSQTAIRKKNHGCNTVVTQASPDYYGEGKPVTIWAENWPAADSPQPIPAASIIPANLSQWVYRAPRDHIVVDPELGRLVSQRASCRKAKFGFLLLRLQRRRRGGEYDRPLSQPRDYKIYYVGEGEAYDHINDALTQWKHGQTISTPSLK